MDATAGAKRVSRWMFVSGVTVASLFALVGCDEPAAQAAKEESPRAVEEAAPSPVGPSEASRKVQATASSSYKEDAFHLTLSPPDSVSAGKELTFKIILEAKGGYKVNEEYPLKFKFADSKDVVPKMATVKKDDAKIEKARAEIPLSVTIKSAGKHDVAGKLSFSVCTEERCLIEKRDLTVSVNAS